MTKRDDKHSRLVAAFIAGLSKEGIERQWRHEFRQGYPQATEDEIWLLFDANKKAGWPPWNIEHAKLVLSDNIWIFEPAWNSPYGGSRYSRHDLAGRPLHKPFCAFRDHWRPDDAVPKSEAAQKTKLRPATAAMLALARAMQVIAGKDLMDDPAMMRDAIDLEERTRKPTAKDFDDAALAVQSARFQYKALDAIKLVLSELPPGYHQSPPLAPLAPL